VASRCDDPPTATHLSSFAPSLWTSPDQGKIKKPQATGLTSRLRRNRPLVDHQRNRQLLWLRWRRDPRARSINRDLVASGRRTAPAATTSAAAGAA
jgi:hypothetical protein